MNSIGLGIIAADEYFKEGDRRKEREYLQARRDAELSTLGDKTEADRSGYRLRAKENTLGLDGAEDKAAADRSGNQLRAKQNTANLSMVDQQTDVARQELANRGADATTEALTKPAKQATAINNAEVNKALSEFNVEDLPRVIAEKRRAGVFSEADAATASVAKLADLIKVGDTNQVITFLNGLNDASGRSKPPVAQVGIVEQNGEKVFVAQDAQGNPIMQLSASQMQRIRDSVGKTEYKTVNAGDSLVALKDGRATPVYTAPESAKSLQAKMGPLERDVNYLTSAHGMTQQQALQHLNSAKTMSREQFILKSAQDAIALGNKPTEKDMAEFGALYDRAQRSAQPGLNNAAPPSNSQGAGTVNPQIRSLLGIPSP